MKDKLSEPSLTEIKARLKTQFVNQVGYTPDFDNPLSFNEKLNWLKLYDRNPLITTCADKYLVRDYVADKIGNEYLIDLLGTYDSPDEIDFDKLPDRFVIKVNWGSGQNIICKDKNQLDKVETLSNLNYWLMPENNLYYYSYEWCYKNIKPKIIIEEYVEQADGNLLDYKFLCYNGKVKNLFVVSDRHTDLKVNFYDLGWNMYPFTRVYPNDTSKQLKPKEFDTMVLLAEKLAENFIFARVDFYILDNNIKFGEITFYPGGGLEPFQPVEWDYEFGKFIELPYELLIKNIDNPVVIFSEKEEKDKVEDSVYIPHIIEDGSCRLLFERKGYVSMINKDKKYDFETVSLLEKYLIYKERQFGGFVDNVPRDKISPHDPRSKEEILIGGMRGGDRMASLENHHGYAAIYAKYLKPFLYNGAQINIAEVGILMGSGLALWCDLFPDSNVYGFDINLDNTRNNIPNLKNLGAFSKNEPMLHELDQFLDNTQYLQKLFKNEKINICIDDGFHSNETILKSFKSFLPFLAENFVYFIEDNAEVHKELMNEYPELSIEADGEMTVIYRKAKENFIQKVGSPLSIMFISHLSDLAGAERSLFDLATKFVKRGIECSVILHSDGPLKKLLNLNGVPAYIIPSSATWWCKNIKFNQDDDIKFFNMFEDIKNDLLPLVQDLNPNVIYSQTIVKPIGAILAQMAGIPHIVAAREYGELDHQFNFRFGFQKSMEALYEDSDLLFTVTDDVRDVVFGKNAGKAVTVYSSISIDETKLDNGKVEYKPIDKNAVVKICIPSLIQESKGQLDAVRACNILVDAGYNIELNLYGQSQAHYIQLIQKFIDENDLAFCVKIRGFNRNNLKLVHDSDIVLSCSVCEAFGRTMLEAALLKRPFVYANSGGTKEVFTNSVHALTYEVGNHAQLAEQIAQTIDMLADVEKRVETVYEYVKQNFNDDRYVETQIKAIYNMLANPEEKSVSACAELINDNIDYKSIVNYNTGIMINIQLFLSRDGHFLEENSIIFDSISMNNQNDVILTIPKNFSANNHIRIDLGNGPQILAMTDIRVKDIHNNVVWKWSGDFADFMITNELQVMDQNGTILCCGDDPYIILPALDDNLILSCIELEIHCLSSKEKGDVIYKKINEANDDQKIIIQQQNEINDQKNIINRQNNELNHRSETINQQLSEISGKNEILLQLNNSIDYLNHQISLIKSTRGYRLLEIFRKIIKKILPKGSKRRSLVKYAVYKPLKFMYMFVRFFQKKETKSSKNTKTVAFNRVLDKNQIAIKYNIITYFVHYDKNAVVSDNDLYLLSELYKSSSKLVFISNSKLAKSELRKIKFISDEIIIRKNKGYDFGAWRDAMREQCPQKYDNAIFVNNSIIGPFYSIADIIDKMLSKKCDFWGMLRKNKGNVFGVDYQEHLQSYFLSFNKRVISSEVFKNFFDSIIDYKDVKDVILQYEVNLTKNLHDAGFSYIAYMDESAPYQSNNSDTKADPVFDYPIELIQFGFPFIKKKVFNLKNFLAIEKILKEKTEFPLGAINPVVAVDFEEAYNYLSSINSKYFDAQYYFDHNIDIPRNSDPLLHFCMYGWKEGRNPSANFSIEQYFLKIPEAANPQINPLYHFHKELKFLKEKIYIKAVISFILSKLKFYYRHSVYAEKYLKFKSLWRSLNDFSVQDKYLFAGMFKPNKNTGYSYNGCIDIIVPIYNGFSYLKGLFADILNNTDVNYRLIVVNDCSPDEKIAPFLAEQQMLFVDKMVLIENKSNVGFIKSVNSAFAVAENHIVIVNTDVRLPENWLSRLIIPIIKDNKIASVTPFSNEATIFSLPQMGAGNSLEGVSFEDIDEILQNINTDELHIFEFPTGVGFCMAMNKNALNSIGYFDEIFGKGYGEENDWCMRAIAKGYKNILAPNLFVYHKHGGSFLSSEKENLIKNNTKILVKRYPSYMEDVRNSLSSRYLKFRDYVSILYYGAFRCKKILVFDHSFGGGAELFVLNKINNEKCNSIFFRLQFVSSDFTYKLTIYHKNNEIPLFQLDGNVVIKTLKIIYFDSIEFNNIVGYSDIEKTLHQMKELKKPQTEVIMYAHDFYSICPSINLLDNNGNFCFLPVMNESEKCEKCEECFECSEFSLPVSFAGKTNRGAMFYEWRRVFNDFFTNTVDKVIAFSEDSINYFIKAYPAIERKVKLVPHEVLRLRKVQIEPHSTINVAFLGCISAYHKGSNILYLMSLLIKEKKYKNIRLVVIGDTSFNLNVKSIGRYDRKNLPKILEDNNIDIIFISSIWPETFSYTTSEAIAMGLPVACFNLGAQAEKVSKYEKGLIISKMDANTALEEITAFIKSDK